MMAFEQQIGVSDFAQMIREAGGSISNGKLLGIAQAGGFQGYRIYIYRGDCGSVEGWISRREAERWIAGHSVEQKISPELLEFARRMKEREGSA